MTAHNYENPEPDVIDMMSEKEVRENLRETVEKNIWMREALEEIAKKEGPFSTDQLTHAGNVIESMASIAEKVLEQVKGGAE